MTKFPPGELDHLKYACLVDNARAKKVLGYEAQYSLKQTLQSARSHFKKIPHFLPRLSAASAE